MLLAKGHPDVGWNPIEGERYLSFLRFAVFVNSESHIFLAFQTQDGRVVETLRKGEPFTASINKCYRFCRCWQLAREILERIRPGKDQE
jgi:hypothetical protein